MKSKMNFSEYKLMDTALEHHYDGNFKEAVKIYSFLIEETGGHDYHLYANRSLTYRYMGLFNPAIEDIKKSLELNPKNPDLYWQFAALISHYVSLHPLDQQITKILLEKGVKLLEQSLQIDPLTEPTWLDLIEKCLICGEYNNALGYVGESDQYITSNHYCLIREWLATLALALSGKSPSDDFKRFFGNPGCLLNGELWSTIEVEKYLYDLHHEGFDSQKLNQAHEIHEIFLHQINHLKLYFQPYHKLMGIKLPKH